MLCYGCHTLIDDPYYLMIIDRSWHLSCLKCINCGILLEQESTCFSREGNFFCKNDYIKKYCSHNCTRCNRIIQQDELILRAEEFIFHLKCFTCNICNILLHPGDDYGLKDNLIYCRDHFFDQDLYDSHLILDDSGYHTSPNETSKIKNYQQENEEHFVNLSSTLFPSSYYIEIDDNSSSNNIHNQKHKRLRTSFKHHQLRYMKSYFHLNHNPDAKDLKNLSEKTNLPKRVLQVWFQNARAKYRRNNTLSKDIRTNLSPSSNSSDL
ncbi:unnamed protein product [Rotaria sordida]|uniref:Uncharacterized protein n=1 Tax=Rotaria sordida TaxID=392033 RepID=A0A814L2N4_9BILA|nr:unnamed protein product [Rotaria sordida]CAF3712900.1 unnamed protein product [Rotaria sordida]